MPEGTNAQRQVAGINKIQTRIGNNRKNGISVSLGVVRTLVKMIPAEMERVIYLDAFFSNNVSIFDDLDVAYIISDWLAISQQEFILGVVWKTLKYVSGSYGPVGIFNPDLKGGIVTRLWVVDNSFSVAVD
jgi:hypothetical protein